MKLVISLFLLVIGQIFAFFQLQGAVKYEWLKNNVWFTILMGIPISAIFIFAIDLLIKHYNGQLWPSRIIGFSVGTIVYAFMSYTLFKEPITFKTSICLILSLMIILIQLCFK